MAFALLVLAGCQRSPKEQVLARVNGEPVTAELFAQYVKTRLHRDVATLDPAAREQALHALLELEAAGGAKDEALAPEIRREVALRRIEYLSRAAAEANGALAEPADADVATAYQAFVAESSVREYHVAHILVPTEVLATEAIGKLKAGVEFGALARAMSADDSKERGGDIGWIAGGGALPKELIEAVQTLEPGKYGAEPVKTSYGWHVVKLIETRAKAAPPLEVVKAQLMANLKEERYRAFLEERLRGSRVEMLRR